MIYQPEPQEQEKELNPEDSIFLRELRELEDDVFVFTKKDKPKKKTQKQTQQS